MNKDHYKNVKETGLDELDSFLILIASLNQEIELFALGGTAMILHNIKKATKDIDFITTLDYESFRKLMARIGLKEASKSSGLCGLWYLDDVRVDVFFDVFILGIPLPEDWKALSKKIKTVNKLSLYTLNWYDIIITKTARSEPRDIEDILMIIQNQPIDFQKLKKRYYNLAETSLIAAYDLKFKVLERRWEKK